MSVDSSNKTPRDRHLGGVPNSFILEDSMSRTAMVSAQLPQGLTLLESTPSAVLSEGMLDLEDTVFDIRTECNLKVLHVLEKRATGKPTTMYIWYQQMDDTNMVTHGLLEIPLYHSSHTKFGFVYKKVREIEEGDFIRENTVLATSPNVNDDGQYGFGRMSNFALYGLLGTHEDGVIMNQDERMNFQATAINHTGFFISGDEILIDKFSSDYPQYGNWVPIPPVGGKLHGDGLVCTTRRINDKFMPLQVNDLALSSTDPIFDKSYYVLPAYDTPMVNGKLERLFPEVIDIEIIANPKIKAKSRLPKELHKYLKDISDENLTMYSDVLRLDDKYHKDFYGRYQQTPELEAFIDSCLREHPEHAWACAKDHKVQFTRQFKHQDIDEFYVKVTTVSKILPTIGYKFSDLHGGKFTVSSVKPREEMLTDEFGRVASFVASPESVSNRNNPGQLHEMVYTDYSFHFLQYLNKLLSENGGDYKALYPHVLEWSELIGASQYKLISNIPPEHVEEVLRNLVEDGNKYGWITMLRPVEDRQSSGLRILRDTIDKPYYPKTGKVRWRGEDGEDKTSKADVRIAPKFIMFLEKDGGYFTAVPSPKRGPLGITAKMSKIDKKTSQHNEQAPRFGEAEFRQMVMVEGPETTAKFFSLVNNPKNNRVIEMKKLEQDNPMDISLGDVEMVHTKSRGCEMLHHLLNTFGTSLTDGTNNE